MKLTRRTALSGALSAAAVGPARADLLRQILLTGPKSSFPTSGLTGLWYFDQYQSTPRPYVPNAIKAAVPVGKNLALAPRRLFSTPLWAKNTGVTATDNFAIGPDGLMEASRLQVTANTDGSLGITYSGGGAPGSGPWTMRCAIKSNTGSSQSFLFGDHNASLDTDTATTSWQVFTKTFASSLQEPCIRTLNSSSPALDLLICDFAVYPGSVDLGPDVLSGHLTLGGYNNNARAQPTYASGALTFGSNKLGLAQFATTQNFSAATVIILGARMANTTAFNWAFRNAQDGNTVGDLVSLAFSNNGPNTLFDNVVLNVPTAPLYPPANTPAIVYGTQQGYWKNFFDSGWAGFGFSYDGTNGNTWLDDIKFAVDQRTLASVASPDFEVATYLSGTTFFPTDWTIASVAVWNRALSEAEYRSAFAALASRAALSGNAPIYNKRSYVAEGDSITIGLYSGGNPQNAYPGTAGSSLSPACDIGVNRAVTSSQISDLTSRAASVDALIPPNPGSRKFILSVLIGHNDLAPGGNYAGNVSAYLTALAAYLDARRAAGWKIVLCTQLPSTVSGFNALRNTANTTLGTWVGTHCDAIADFAANATMGPDAAASNTTYYIDGIHPSVAGHALLAPILAAAVNTL